MSQIKLLEFMFNILDKLDRVKSVAQWALKQVRVRYVYLYINSKLEGDTIGLLV